jgi:hypothetical protein
MKETLDDHILEAMRHPARMRLQVGLAELQTHRKHEGFQYEDSPRTRSYNFSCPQCDYHWYIDVADLRSQLPEVREKVLNLRLHHVRKGNKALKKAKYRAEQKARALLCRTISRDQARSYKKLGYLEVLGQNGLVYKVGASGYHNVTTEIDGVLHRYCILPEVTLPKSDTVLAQKLWLERDTAGFLETANLIEPRAVPEVNPDDIVLPEGVENDPKEWVAEQIHAATRPEQ